MNHTYYIHFEDLAVALVGPFVSLSNAMAHIDIVQFKGCKSAVMGIYRDDSPAYEEAKKFAQLKITPEKDLSF